MNMEKQTAVEWIIQWSKENPIAYQSDYHDAIEQAKAMERTHIIDAYNSGYQDVCNRKDDTRGSIYYNQTFGQ